MSAHSTACCVVIHRQQQANLNYRHELTQAPCNNSDKCQEVAPKYCTVVENGRVVVKPRP